MQVALGGMSGNYDPHGSVAQFHDGPGGIERKIEQPFCLKAIERSLLKRACTPADIAAAIVFLCADTGMVTAQTLVVDGGYSL